MAIGNDIRDGVNKQREWISTLSNIGLLNNQRITLNKEPGQLCRNSSQVMFFILSWVALPIQSKPWMKLSLTVQRYNFYLNLKRFGPKFYFAIWNHVKFYTRLEHYFQSEL